MSTPVDTGDATRLEEADMRVKLAVTRHARRTVGRFSSTNNRGFGRFSDSLTGCIPVRSI